MSMINLNIDPEIRKKNIQRCREKGIILPTFEQMKHPEKIPAAIKKKLDDIELWEMNPLNLFRISWQNEPKAKGGEFTGVNYIEIPQEITGVKAKIIALVGKWFPTGAHKVGATYGCLAPALVSGTSTPPAKKPSGPPRGTTAGAEPTTAPSWTAPPSPSSRRK
jgi:cysteine synthase A